MITRVSLADGTDEFSFQDPSWGNYDDIVWKKLSVPSPAVRASVKDRTGASGTNDRTKFHGARAVSLEVHLAGAPAAKVDELNVLLHPARRPYLVVTDSDWSPVATRRMLLRSDQWSNEIINTGSWFRDPQFQWVNPTGVWESLDLTTFRVDAALGLTGRSYPLRHPRRYPATGAAGRVTFVNPGNTDSDFIARLYGPCNGPRLTNDMTGESIAFREDFVLAAGEYVEVNTAETTAFHNSDPSLTRLPLISYASSSWWKVKRGSNAIRYNPISGVDQGCIAEFDFRPNWI